MTLIFLNIRNLFLSGLFSRLLRKQNFVTTCKLILMTTEIIEVEYHDPDWKCVGTACSAAPFFLIIHGLKCLIWTVLQSTES